MTAKKVEAILYRRLNSIEDNWSLWGAMSKYDGQTNPRMVEHMRLGRSSNPTIEEALAWCVRSHTAYEFKILRALELPDDST